MRTFTMPDRDALLALLKERGVMTEEEADRFTYALLDIRESVVEIYDEYLPKLISELKNNEGDVEDTIWDIRESCRHIDYHLKDAKLPPGS